MRLFVHEMDDLHQWDFIWNLRLREFLLAINEQRETLKRRAIEAKLAQAEHRAIEAEAKLAQAERRAMEAEAKLAQAERRAMEAEAKLAQAADNVPSTPGQNVSDVRYAALKRYLAKQFHPDHAPGYGIEKVVRNEIFKEIWGEIERLNQTASPRTATAGR
jgi:hypothetical protein